MICREFREIHPAQTAESQVHVSDCAECRAYIRSWEILSEYPAIAPSPDFARGIRRKLSSRVLRFMAPLAAGAAALLISSVIFFGPSRTVDIVSAEERELVENLELIEDYELLSMLEWVSDGESALLGERPQ